MLKQTSSFFNKKTFEITNTGLSVREKTIISKRDYFVEFDNIGSKELRTKSGKAYWLIISFFAFMISLVLFVDQRHGGNVEDDAYLFYLVISLACIIIYFFTYKQSFFLLKPDNTYSIEFFNNKPNKIEFENFINELIERRNKILTEKYGQIILQVTYDQNYNNQIWLLNNNVITQDEFKKIVTELDKLYKKTERIIGFKNTNE
jgi:hypothetical protein